ncbi:MAG: hypothetical protein GY869_23645, partial [Planctomycetes bacterium]|nr:hypothetical protein [Planctomycetota bacterium]
SKNPAHKVFLPNNFQALFAFSDGDTPPPPPPPSRRHHDDDDDDDDVYEPNMID